MATESPIRMMVPRGKWSSHPGSVTYQSSSGNVVMDENGLPVGSQYRNPRFYAPNRSGSAPPSMEGSLAALENLMHNSLNPNLQQPVSSASEERLLDDAGSTSNNQRSSFLDGSRGILPTHREESEDDSSPQHAYNDWTEGNSPMWSEQDVSSSVSGHKSFVDQTQGPNADSNSLPDQSISAPNLAASSISVNDTTSSQEASASRSMSHVRIEGLKDDQSSLNCHLENEALGTDNSEIANVQSRIRALRISPPTNLEIQSRQEERQPFQENFVKHPNQPNTIFPFHNLMHQVASQGMTSAYIDMSQVSHLGKLPAAEMQPLFQPSTPTTYAASPAYLPPANPYYSGMQPPGVMYSPPYGIGGYNVNPMLFPPYLSGYPPHSAVPFNFNSASIPQYSPLALSSGFVHDQGNAFNSQTRPDFSGAASDHRSQNQATGRTANVNQRRGAVASPNYFRSSTNMGVLQIQTSPLPSPVVPSSPIGGNFPFGRSETCFPHDSSRNAGFYAGWPGQRGYETLNCTKTYSFLEELKSGKGRRHEISDIAGHHGSRFIQQKLENCSAMEKASVFKEVLPHATKLMTDVFGNYVIQKLFEYGTSEQRKELANQMQGEILSLSLQMYGCRVIQKALEVIELEQKAELVHELDGHVLRCVRDQNGNHVIQKCIESIPLEKVDFVISAFHGHVANLSMHPYGCRVIQRVLERCKDGSQSQFIIDEILESVCILAQNQYGNYVTQHVLERGKSEERIQIIKKLAGQVVQMSQHKFASNVVEKCLEYGDTEGQEFLIQEIIGMDETNDSLLVMMKDQYANYVVQKILDLCTDSQRDLLKERIKIHLNALRKYTYGKHIVTRFEQLFAEDFPASVLKTAE
ncbi:hypothetical protein V2J09_009615 [Rumex salicifolius]